jgi:hypothetical protein
LNQASVKANDFLFTNGLRLRLYRVLAKNRGKFTHTFRESGWSADKTAIDGAQNLSRPIGFGLFSAFPKALLGVFS